MKIDFTKVAEFNPIPIGKYRAKVFDVIATKAATGNPMTKWTFVVTDGKYKNRKVFDNIMLLEESLPWLAKRLETLGISVTGKVADIKWPELKGLPCIIDVGIHEYKGQDKNDIQGVYPPTEEQKTTEEDKLFNTIEKKETKKAETEEEGESEEDEPDGDDALAKILR